MRSTASTPTATNTNAAGSPSDRRPSRGVFLTFATGGDNELQYCSRRNEATSRTSSFSGLKEEMRVLALEPSGRAGVKNLKLSSRGVISFAGQDFTLVAMRQERTKS